MKEFNVIVTIQRSDWRALPELNRYGEFTETGFRDVYLGLVADVSRFLDEMERAKQESAALEDLSRVIPIDVVFAFQLPELEEKLSGVAGTYLECIGETPFFVRVKRRGYKGRINSFELEKKISSVIYEGIKERGKTPRVSFSDARLMLDIEIFPNRCGIGLITREMAERSTLIRMK